MPIPIYKKGYHPRPGERQIGFLNPGVVKADKSILRKSILRKNKKLLKQGKVGLGKRTAFDETFHRWVDLVGIPIGQKTVFFKLHRGRPIVQGGVKEYRTATEYLTNYRGIAQMRANFSRLPESERNIALGRAKQELLKIRNKKRSRAYAEYRRRIQEAKKAHAMAIPAEHDLQGGRNILKRVASAMEADAAWERFSENIHMRNQLFDEYRRRRKELVEQGKTEPPVEKKPF